MTQIQNKRYALDQNKIDYIYDTLKEGGMKGIGKNYAEFRKLFVGGDEDSYKRRKYIFATLKEGEMQGIGNTYEEFMRNMMSGTQTDGRGRAIVQKPRQQSSSPTQSSQQNKPKPRPMSESAVRDVYDQLSKTGDARGTYEQFRNNFVGDGVDRYHNRLNAYRQLKAAGANVPGTYEEFMRQYMTTPSSSSAPQKGMTMDEMQMWAADAQGNVQGMIDQGKSFVDGLRASVAHPLDVNQTTLGGANRSTLSGVTQVGKSLFRTQSGNVYSNETDANSEQIAANLNESDNAAYSKIAELDKQIDELQKQAEEDAKKHQNYRPTGNSEAMNLASSGVAALQNLGTDYQNRINQLKAQRAVLLRGTQFGADLSLSINGRLAQINQALSESYKYGSGGYKPNIADFMNKDIGAVSGGNYGNAYLNAAKNYLADAQKMIAEAKAGSMDPNNLNGFFRGAKRGLADGALDVRTWDYGITDYGNVTQLRKAADKWDRGENLTYDEQVLLDAMATKMSVDAYFASGMGRGYKAGKVTAESIPFMIEMLVNPASATGKSLQAIVARYALKNFGKKGLQNVGRYAARTSSMQIFKTALSKSAPSALRKAATKQFATRAVTRAGGDALGAMSMSATTGQMRVWADALNRMTGQARYRVDNHGLVRYDGHDDPEETSLFKAYGKAFFDNAIQNHSEMVSAYIPYVGQLLKSGLGRLGGREVARLLGRAKAASVRAFNKLPKADMIADLTHNLTHNSYVDIADGIRKRANIGGPIEEYLEEVIGNAETAIVTGDMDFSTEQGKGVFNLSDNIDTFLGVSLMTGAFSVFGAAGYRTPHYRAVRALQRADEAGQRLYEGNEGAWEQLKQHLDECKTQNERNAVLMTALGSRASEAQKQAVLGYVRASQFLEGVKNGTYAKMQEEAENDDELGTRRGCINSYMNGQNMTDSQSRREALLDFNAKRNRALALEPDAEFYDSPELYDHLNPNASSEQRKAVSEYAQAKAKVDGINDAIDDRYRHVTSSIEDQVGRIANTSGNIIEVELEGRHGKYYVRSGNISVNPEGYVNHAFPDRTVVFVDEYGFPVAGNMDASTIEGKVKITNAQSVIDGVRARAEEVRNAERDAMNGILSFNSGSSFNIIDESGEQHKVSIVQDEHGNAVAQMDGAEGVLPLTDDAKATLQSKADMWQQMNYEGLVREQEEAKAQADAEVDTDETAPASPASLQQDQAVAFTDADGNVHEGRVNGETADGGWEIEFDHAPEGKGNVDTYTSDELNALGIAPIVEGETAETAPTAADVESEAASAEEGSSTNSQPSETQSTDEASTPSTSVETSNVETKQRAIDRIPTDGQGQHIYEQASVEDTAAALIEQMGGDVDEATENAKMMLSQMQGKAKKAAKRLEDIKDGKVEATMDEIVQAKNSAKVIGQNVKYWEDVVKFLEDVKRGQEAVAEEEARAEEAAPAEVEAAPEAAPAEAEASEAAEPKAVEVAPEAKSEEEKAADSKAVESEDVEPKPIGTGVFGNIFNQFKGKVKEAFDFLMKHKSGDLLGVFHRDDVGDIDLVWGDYDGGLGHIIRRHIEEQNDFSSVDEIMRVIEDVILHGKKVKENNDKVNIEYNGYKVSIKKKVRDENGNIIENKNWIVTAFDKSIPKHEKRRSSSSETLTTPSANPEADGVTLPSNDESSTDKVTESSAPAQTEGKENEAKDGVPYYWSEGYFDSLTDEQKRKFEDLAESLGGHIDWENSSLTMPSEEAAKNMVDAMDKERAASSDSNSTEKHSERAEEQGAEEAKPADPDANLRADIRAARDMAKMMFPDVNAELLDKIARDLNQQPLTGKQREQMERIAKAFGLRIRWFKTMPQNGTYSREKGEICIATDSWHQLSDTFGHEMTHALKDVDMDAYNRMKEAVIEASARNEAERKGLQRAIDLKYSGYDAKDRMEEYVSDKIGAAIASRDLADKILFNLDHKVLGRMRDIVTKMRAAVSDFSFNTENKVRGLLHMEERVRDERVPSALDNLQEAIMDAYRMAQKTELERRAEEKRKAEEEKKKEEERKKMDEGVKRSERVEASDVRESKRSDFNNEMDTKVAELLGSTPKRQRELRKARELEHKLLTKDLYENVLKGNFDAVTLQKIDDFINNVTPYNPYARPLSQRLPQRVGRKVSEGERTGRIDALFSRISESAVPANERTRPEAKRRIEEKKKELLKGWAIATGNWHTDIRDFVDDTKPIGSGKDSDVYHGKDGQSVIKVSKGKDNLKRFRPDMDNVALFNYVFRNSQYRILGYGEIDGKFVRFLRQPIVDFTDSTPLSVEERVSYMERMGFRPMNDEKTAFTNGEIVASDIQGNNIVRDRNGNIRVIDADMRLHTKDVGGSFMYPPVDDDTRLPQGYVANNSESSKSSEENGTKESRRSLVGVHNITEEKLAKALKLGGLANPSVAVVDSDKGTHDSFGEISLILPSSMVDKQTGRNAGTFIGDAYTPRFPSISKVISSKGYNKMAKAAEKLPDATMAEEMRRAFVADYLDDGRSGGLEYWFLHDKGMEPKVVKKAGAMWSSDVEAVRKATDCFYAKPKDLNREQIETLRDVAAHYGGKTREYWDEKRKEYLDSAKDESKKENVRDFFQRLADQIEHYGMTERDVTNLIQNANYESSNKGDTDVNATRMQAANYVRNNGLESDYNDWLEEKNAAYDVKDKLFQGYTYSGNRRYKDATLENISKEMKKQGLNDAEGFSDTFHSFVASVLKPVGSLDEIRERKVQLTNDKSVLDDFEKITRVYSDLTSKLRDRDGYDWNAGYERLKEIASKKNPKKYAKNHYGDVLNEGDLNDLEFMLNEIKRKPSKYFETKFERPVMLNEFVSAVVPSDISEKVRKGLEEAGLKLHEYDRNKEGDRERAFNEAINERDDVKFSKRNSSSNEYTPEERSKFKGVPISKQEYAKLFHAIHTHNQFKVGRINGEFTRDYYYLYTHHGDGDFTIEAQIPKDDNEDLIRILNERVENGTIEGPGDLGILIEGKRIRQNGNYSHYASPEGRPRRNGRLDDLALRHEADRRRGHEQVGERVSGRSSSEVYPADRGGRIDDEAGDVVSELVNSINTESFKDVQRILSIYESKDKLEEFWDKAVNEHLKPWDEVNKRALAILHIAIDERKAELEGNGPAEKFSLRDGSFIRSGSYFSGGGLLEEGLKNYLDPRVAVEFNEKIAGVYADNFGRHIVTADVRNVDPRELTAHVDGSVEYFHASPVCKNFSRAKREAGEVELDKETAQSTADFIRANRPRVVTIENVKGYRGSDALKIITDALTEEGYDWDADVYSTGDFGGYTKRERLIVRAVRDGKLPEKPKPLPLSERKGGWMEAVTDLMDSLPEKRSGVPEWMDKRLKAMGIDWRNIDKPLYVLGQGDAADKVSHAFADELLPTLRTKGGDVIIMPDGRVLRATPRVLARVTGLADDYKMPVTDDMAHTIVGNGIPSQLSEHVVGPLLEHVFNGGEPVTHDKKESRRVSGRLANTGNTSSVAQRIYEEAVRGRTFEWDEAWHDSLVSVKALQDALAKERGADIRDLENVYLHLVHLSSVSAAEMTEYRNQQVENLLSAMNAILKDKKLHLTEQDVETYLNCKHGLERNEHIARKKAKAEADEKYGDDLKKLQDTWVQSQRNYQNNPNQQTQNAMDKAQKDYTDKLAERDQYEDDRYDKHRKEDDYSGLTAIFDDPKNPTMTNEELEDKARDLVADMEQKIGQERIDGLWDAIHDATLFSLHKSYKSGLISKETYNEVKDMYEWYVPLRGFAEDTANDVYEYMEHAEPKTQQELKNAKGRTSRSDGILANIMNMGSSAILHGNQNLAKQKLLNLAINSKSSLLSLNTAFYKPSNKMDAQGNPYDELVQIPDYILNEDDADVRRQFMEQWTQQMEADPDVKTKFDKLNLDYRTLYGVQNEHAVSVFRGGKQYMVYVNGNPRAAQAINGTNIVRHDGALSKAMSKVTRWMSQMMTSYNPSFVTSNAQRDFTSALLISEAKYGAGYTARFANNVRTVFPFLFAQINGGKKFEPGGMYQLYWKHKHGTLDMNRPIEKYFSEFMANGGETGYTQSMSVDDYKNFIEKELKNRKRNKVVRFGKKPFGAFMGFVEELNRGIENSCRFAAYMTSRETGRSVLQSVQDAKEVSTNFNLHGSGALGNAFFRDAYAFTNPAIQSLVQYMQLTKQHPKKMLFMAASTFALGVMTTWMMASMVGPLGGGDGDDDKDEGDPASDFWNINPYTRRNYLLIPIPKGKGNWMKIAMAPEIRAFYGIGVMTAEALLGRLSTSDCAVGVLDQLNQLMPKQFIEPTETFKKDDGKDYTIGKQFAGSMMPTSLEPIYRAWWINRDFMGKQITNQSDWNEDRPEWQRASYNTSEWLVNTAKWLNNVTSDHPEFDTKGYINFNPSRWGYLTYSYFGGIGQLYDQGRGLFKGVVQEDEEFDERLRYIPVINRMFTTTNNEYNKYQDSNARFQYYEGVHSLNDYMLRNGRQKIQKGEMGRYEMIGKLWTDPDYNRGLLMDAGKWLKQIDKLKELRKATNDEQQQKEYSHQINEVRKNAVRVIMYAEEHGGLDKVDNISAGYRNVKNEDQLKALNAKRDATIQQVLGEAMKKYPNPFPFKDSESQKDEDKEKDE